MYEYLCWRAEGVARDRRSLNDDHASRITQSCVVNREFGGLGHANGSAGKGRLPEPGAR